MITDLPENIITLKDFIEWKNIPTGATAIAINGKIADISKSEIISFEPNDNLMVITAAYGG